MVRDARRQYESGEALTSEQRAARNARRARARAAGTLVEPEPPPRVEDWRTPEDRTADHALLQGTWWRCRTHGLTQETILLGGAVYCTHGDCTEQLLLARSAMRDAVQGSAWVRFDPATGSHPPLQGKQPRRAPPEPSEPVDELPAPEPPEEPAISVEETPAAPHAPEEHHMAKRGESVQIIMDELSKHRGGVPTAALLTVFSAARPDLGDRASQNMGAVLQRLQKTGRIARGVNGWTVVESAGAAAVPGEARPPASAAKRARRGSKKARREAPAPDTESAAPGVGVDMARGKDTTSFVWRTTEREDVVPVLVSTLTANRLTAVAKALGLDAEDLADALLTGALSRLSAAATGTAA